MQGWLYGNGLIYLAANIANKISLLRASAKHGPKDMPPFVQNILVLMCFNGRFYTRDALSVWTNLGKHL